MESIKEIRSPLGGINTDDDDILIPQMDYRDARNSVTDVASFKNAPSNKSALDYAINSGFQLYEGTNRTMGVAKDEKNNALIEFVWNQFEGHSIIRWYKEDNKLEYILSGQSILNFDYTKAHLINNPFVVDNLLYWTDNYNPPRKIDINKAIEFTLHPPIGVFHRQVRVNDYLTGYATDTLGLLIFSTSVHSWLYPGQKIVIVCPTADRLEQTGDATVVTIVSYTYQTLVVTDRPWYVNDDIGGDVYQWNTDGQYYGLTEENISRMKYPPIFSPTTSYSTDILRKTNYLKNRFFYFRCRYYYDNHEYSTWGPISQVIYPEGEGVEYGYSWGEANENNVINVWYWTGSQEVVRVEVAFRDLQTQSYKLLARVEKYDTDGNVLLPSNVYHSELFYNDVDGEALDQSEINKSFNNVPELCGESELIGENRIIDGDITEGKDNVVIDVSLSCEIAETSFPPPINVNEPKFYTTWKYDGGGDLDMIANAHCYPFEHYPVATFEDRMWIVNYTTSAGSGPETDENPYTRFSFSFLTSAGDTMLDLLERIKETTNQSSGKRIRCWYTGDEVLAPLQFLNATEEAYYYANKPWIIVYADYVDGTTGELPMFGSSPYDWVVLQDVKLTSYTQSGVYPSYKYGSTLYGGVIYFDEQGRYGGVNKSEDSVLKIPDLNEANSRYIELYDPGVVSPNYIKVAYSINHRPPLWAKYWTWAIAKNTPVFRYAVAYKFKTELGKTYFNVDKMLMDMVDDIPSGSQRPYYFAKGDRVRFLAGQITPASTSGLSPSFNRLVDNLDFEILGEDYDEKTINHDPNNYMHYEDMTYWTDKDGNRVRNLYARKLYVNGFDCSIYNITEEDSSVTIERAYDAVLVEIYTPNQNMTSDGKDVIYFESNKVFEIGNAGTANAYHKADVNQAADLSTPATGYLDCQNVFLKLRTYTSESYRLPVEDVNFSDYYESDAHNVGRINKFIYDAQRQRYKGKLQFGGVYYENSQINNLSSVDAADFVMLSEKFGAITGLREIGYTLKVLQEFKRTSIYVNKVGLMQSGGEGQVVAATSRLFGDVNISEDDFGCQDPESILVVDRSLVFYDRNIGKLIRDYSNGPVAISDLKTITLFQDLKDSILSHSEESFVQTGYDSFNGKIYLLMFYVVPNGVLINGSYAWQTNDPTFIECVGFSTRRNRTVSKFDFQYGDGLSAEAMGNMGDAFVCFKDGVPWIHGQSTYCNFFGWQWAQKIKFTFNGSAQAEKIWENISVISNVLWSAPDNYDIQIAPNATYPRGMCSRLAAGKFTTIRGVSHAEFLRNMLSSSAVPSVVDLVNGDFLDGNSISVQLSNEETGEVILKSVIVQSLIHK